MLATFSCSSQGLAREPDIILRGPPAAPAPSGINGPSPQACPASSGPPYLVHKQVFWTLVKGLPKSVEGLLYSADPHGLSPEIQFDRFVEEGSHEEQGAAVSEAIFPGQL